MELAIEELSLAAWPALQTELYDGWVLRFAEGHTKRSNSVSSLYAGSLGLEEKIAHCEAAYADRGLPTTFKILDAPAAGEAHRLLDAALAERGYGRVDETAVMALELGAPWRFGCTPRGGIAPRLPEGASLRVEGRISPAWIGGYCSCSKLWEKREIVGRMLDNAVPGIAAASVLAEGGGIVACGYGAMGRGWVGLFDIVVKEEWRRRGLGEALVRAILAEAARRGSERAYLQVVSGNAPAEGLYRALGFREAYRYWYRRKG